MKTIKVVLAALVISGLSFSCGSDDGEDPMGGDLTARWNETKTINKISGETYTIPYDDNQPGCPKDFIEFTESGTFNRAIYVEDINNDCVTSADVAYEWQREGNDILISGGNYGGEYVIKKLTSSDLVIEREEIVGSTTTVYTIYFKKAAQ